MASSDDIPPSLEADFVALRKLRDDDPSGVDSQFVVAVVGVHVSEGAKDIDKIEEAAKELNVVVHKEADLEGLPKLLAQRASGEGQNVRVRPPRPILWVTLTCLLQGTARL